MEEETSEGFTIREAAPDDPVYQEPVSLIFIRPLQNGPEKPSGKRPQTPSSNTSAGVPKRRPRRKKAK